MNMHTTIFDCSLKQLSAADRKVAKDANTDRFRSRSGSLTPAVCLVTAIWMAAMVLVWLSLAGRIKGWELGSHL